MNDRGLRLKVCSQVLHRLVQPMILGGAVTDLPLKYISCTYTKPNPSYSYLYKLWGLEQAEGWGISCQELSPRLSLHIHGSVTKSRLYTYQGTREGGAKAPVALYMPPEIGMNPGPMTAAWCRWWSPNKMLFEANEHYMLCFCQCERSTDKAEKSI